MRRRRHARGDVIVVRWADDFIVGFEHEQDARWFLDELRERFAKFGLDLHPGKTRNPHHLQRTQGGSSSG